MSASLLDPSFMAWPPINANTTGGRWMRSLSTLSWVLALLWIFVMTVPLAIHDEDDRKRVRNSSLYINTAAVPELPSSHDDGFVASDEL